MNWFAEFSWFTKILATSQLPDIPINADTQRKSPSSMNKIEGDPAFASIAELPVVPESLSIVTPPHVTRQVIQQAIAAGVKNIWMQPGAEDSKGSHAARDAGLNVIDDGSCILVLLSIERSSK